MTPCPHMEKFTPDAAMDSLLSKWAFTFSFTDVGKNLPPTYVTMSRIDLVYVSSSILAKVQEACLPSPGGYQTMPHFW